MSEYTIQFNYNKALGQASELKSIASSLKNISESSLVSTMNSISKNWTGSNSDEYVKKGNSLKEKIKHSSDDIYGVAGNLETMAGNIYRAEMEALRIAQTSKNKK